MKKFTKKISVTLVCTTLLGGVVAPVAVPAFQNIVHAEETNQQQPISVAVIAISETDGTLFYHYVTINPGETKTIDAPKVEGWKLDQYTNPTYELTYDQALKLLNSAGFVWVQFWMIKDAAPTTTTTTTPATTVTTAEATTTPATTVTTAEATTTPATTVTTAEATTTPATTVTTAEATTTPATTVAATTTTVEPTTTAAATTTTVAPTTSATTTAATTVNVPGTTTGVTPPPAGGKKGKSLPKTGEESSLTTSLVGFALMTVAGVAVMLYRKSKKA